MTGARHSLGALFAATAALASAAALAGVPGVSDAATATCRPVVNFTLCKGTITVHYGGKTVKLRHAECDLRVASTLPEMMVSANYPQTPGSRYLVLTAYVKPKATRAQSAALQYNPGGKGVADLSEGPAVTLAPSHRKGTFKGFTQTGHKPLSGAFTCA
jgi:hypothetical protein